jgi:hypothetical protein
MKIIVTALRWVARLDGLAALIFGVLLWTGSAGSNLKIHIMLGFVLTLTLLLSGLLGFFARLKPVLPILAVLWAISLPYVGFAQLKLFPGSSHIAIQVVHLLIGVCGIGLVEAVGAKIVASEEKASR